MNKKAKRKFRIDTFGHGVYYRWASNACAAVSRIVYMLFGPGYTGYEHDYWKVEEV